MWIARLLHRSLAMRDCGSLMLTQIIMINVLGRPQKDAKTLILTHTLHILPLMYWMDLLDILFLVKCLKDETDTIGIFIFTFISFVKSSTRAGTTKRLKHNYCRTSTSWHFYFNRVVLLRIPLPTIDLQQKFPTVKHKRLCLVYGTIFINSLMPPTLAS